MAEQEGLLRRAYKRVTQPSRGEEVKAGLLAARRKAEEERLRRLEEKRIELAALRRRETLLPGRRPLTGLGAADVGLNMAMTAPQSLLGMIAGGLGEGAKLTGEAVRGDIDLQDPAQTVRALAAGPQAMTGGLLARPGGLALGAGPIRPKGAIPIAPRYHSAVESFVAQSKQDALPGKEWTQKLRAAPGVKKEEYDWLELDSLLGQKTPDKIYREGGVEIPGGKPVPGGGKSLVITKQELLDHIQARKVVPKEPVYGYDLAAEAKARKPATVIEMMDLEDRLLGTQRLGLGLGTGPAHFAGLLNRAVERQAAPQSLRPSLLGRRGVTIEAAPFTPRPQEVRLEALREAAVATRTPPPQRSTQYGTGGPHTMATPPGGTNYREIPITLEGVHQQGPLQAKRLREGEGALNRPYRHGHWKDDNVVLANRYDERVIDGVPSLANIENQSDIHQIGRDQGYLDKPPYDVQRKNAPRLYKKWWVQFRGNQYDLPSPPPGEHANFHALPPNAQEKFIKWFRSNFYPTGTDMPLKEQKAWTTLGAKQHLREAAESGIKQVVWAHSDQHVQRWGNDPIRKPGFEHHYDDMYRGAIEKEAKAKARLVTEGKDRLGNDLKWWVVPLSDEASERFLTKGFGLFTRGVPAPAQEDKRKGGGLLGATPPPPPMGRGMIGGGLLGP